MTEPTRHPDLVALLRGQLTQPDALAAGTHLETCAACREALVDAAVTHGLMTRAVATTGRFLLGERPEGPGTADAPGETATPIPPVATEPPPARPEPATPPTSRRPPVPPPVRGRRRRTTLAVAAATLVVLGAAGGLAASRLLGDDRADGGSVVAPAPSDQPSDQPTTPVVPTTAPATTTLDPVRGNGTGSLWLTPHDGVAELTLRTAGMPAAGAREYYYAWLIDAAGNRLLPLGQVASGGTTTFEVDPAVLAQYALVDVSLERDDGDPGHSADSLLRGVLA
ncbi:anti-sigma factor [Nocardioides nanhaiensis]|uniref:Anti-sigma K factor RskA C-terminal domain-containing protein n=1 Tax=Nocardioides nanhaiensis TaxID=1476871 RepID=A0ABP8WA67_9ACTN